MGAICEGKQTIAQLKLEFLQKASGLVRIGVRQLREQPAGTLAKRAKLAARLHNQERFGWDSPARGIAAFTATYWQPN